MENVCTAEDIVETSTVTSGNDWLLSSAGHRILLNAL